MHMPPPVHGAAMVGQYIHDSKLINDTFECHYLNLTLAKNLNDIGKGSVKKFYSFCQQLNRIRKEINRVSPELCYITPNTKGGAFYKDFCIIVLLKLMKQNIIAHYHNKGVAMRQENTIDNILYKRFFKGQKVILLANALYQDMQKYVSPKDVYICPNGIPTNNGVERKEILQEAPQILFLSNMMEAKGVWDLVDACRLLKEQGKVFTCHFVGKWSDIRKEVFNEEVHRNGLEVYIKSHGGKYGNEKRLFFQKTDLFIFPTHYETFGLVLLEAMEYGIPCIATNEGGIPSIVENNKTGYIVGRQNPQALAEKITFLLDHPEICKEMGKAGKEKFLKEFTLEIFENRIKEILIDCCTSYRSS